MVSLTHYVSIGEAMDVFDPSVGLQEPPELEFDQSEKITNRLKDLVRSYPKGIGLVKEFLQNADDAGASRLVMVLDRRTHPGSLGKAEMDVVLGPSLLFSNDRQFSELDFGRIQDLGGGGKLEEASGTGRFGQGFNTCFSVTDHPSLLTGSRIAWFDPHKRTHGTGKNARAWKLNVARKSWPAWIRTFSAAGLEADQEAFPGAVFRLPLRTPADARRSEILKESFSDEHYEKILLDLAAMGPAMFLFLRNILHFEVREIAPDGRTSLRYQVSTTNPDEVTGARAGLAEVGGDPLHLLEQWAAGAPLPLARYPHRFQVQALDGTQHEEVWAVVTGLFAGPGNALLQSAMEVCRLGEKALPWAGAAARTDGAAKEHRKGGLACFLPLPEDRPWPVYVHGWFDLDSSRRGLTGSRNIGDSVEARAAWNLELMEHGAGPAWVMLLELMRPGVKTKASPYTLWPKPMESADEFHQALLRGFYAQAALCPLLRVRSQACLEWQALKDGAFEVGSPQLLASLRDPLLAEGWGHFEPSLPDPVRKGFAQAGQHVPTLDRGRLGQLLRQHCGQGAWPLPDAPMPMLRDRKWVTAIAEFCAGEDPEQLAELPLALLADGKLHAFHAGEAVYLPSQDHLPLFKHLPHRLLDAEFQAALRLTEPAPALDLKPLDLAGLMDCARETLALGKPDTAWLQCFFTFLGSLPALEISTHREELREFRVVPDQHGRLQKMTLKTTPLMPRDDTTQYRATFEALDLPIVKGPKNLVQAIRFLMEKHPGSLVWDLAPGDVFEVLEHFGNNGSGLDEKALDDPEVRRGLLNFLTTDEWLTLDDRRIPGVRKVRFLPTLGGGRAAADEPQVYLPGNFHPPADAGGCFHFLDGGPEGRWLGFFRGLGMRPLEGDVFIDQVLLPTLESGPRERHKSLLRWLRDNLTAIESGLTKPQRQALHVRIRSASILPVKSGGRLAPAQFYLPGSREPRRVLGDLARYPDPRLTMGEEDLWLGFFQSLGLGSAPYPVDLHQAILAISQNVGETGLARIRQPLGKIQAYLQDHWDSLRAQELPGLGTFSAELAKTPWLFAVSLRQSPFPGQMDWEDKLWLAREVHPPRFGNLVASQLPILDGPELSAAMAADLQHPIKVPIEHVAPHFGELKRLRPADEAMNDAIGKAVQEIYRYLGRLDEQEWATLKPTMTRMTQDKAVYVEGRWLVSGMCFFKPFGFHAPNLTSLADQKNRLEEPMARLGLKRLGVRETPDVDDWRGALAALAERNEGAVLPDRDLTVAIRIIANLKVLSPTAFIWKTFHLPTQDGRLVLNNTVFINDDPRMRAQSGCSPVSLLRPQKDVLEFAELIGVRHLRSSLSEVLADLPIELRNSDLENRLAEIHRRIRSAPFLHALRRLAAHEVIEFQDPAPGSSLEDSLKLARNLRIRVAKELRTEARVEVDGAEVLVYATSQNQQFLERDTAQLWIRQANWRTMREQVVIAICKLTALKDQFKILNLLETDPEAMEQQLDEDGISTLPEADEDDPLEDLAPAMEESEEAVNPAPSAGDWPAPGDGEAPTTQEGPARLWPKSTGSHRDARQAPRAAAGPMARPPARLKGCQPPPPPTAPGQGVSNIADPARNGNSNSQGHLRTYLHHDPQEGDASNGRDQERISAIGRAGEEAVLAFELAQNRKAQAMPRNHEGFDIQSEGPEGRRFIEVKAMDGPWGLIGVGISRAQYEAAQQLGSEWWLYVVEHAKDAALRRIHPLRNPVARATEFRFDGGWAEVSAEAEDAVPPPTSPRAPVAGATYCRRDGTRVEVVEVEARGAFWLVTTRPGTGAKVPWDPTWQRI
jgi:sacsin